jgi:hypothetical protein
MLIICDNNLVANNKTSIVEPCEYGPEGRVPVGVSYLFILGRYAIDRPDEPPRLRERGCSV